VSCHGFFPVGYKEFGSLLITDCIRAVNNPTVLVNPNLSKMVVMMLGLSFNNEISISFYTIVGNKKFKFQWFLKSSSKHFIQGKYIKIFVKRSVLDRLILAAYL
jgi:hypothetical protein